MHCISAFQFGATENRFGNLLGSFLNVSIIYSEKPVGSPSIMEHKKSRTEIALFTVPGAWNLTRYSRIWVVTGGRPGTGMGAKSK